MSDTQINVGMNVDGVVAGTNKAKAELRTLQAEVDKVSRASKEGGAALGKVGEGVDADKAAKQLSRIAQQVKRVSDEAVLGRNSVELFAEKLAKTGVSADVYRPLLEAYGQVRKSAEQANAAFTKSGQVTNELTQGTKAYSAALRQVPAQFTDIIVSLQGGQAPMTVLLQQGGQLKDVFGSVGSAARALGSYVAGLINPYTAAAAAIATVGTAAYQGAQDIKAFELALALSGNASGVTVDQMRQLALSTGASADALAQFARAGVSGTEGLQKFSEAAVRFEKYTGIAVKESVAAWKSLGDEPVKNALKLNETIAFLTPTIYAQIKALESQGKAFEAGVLAQNAYAQAQQRIADGAESKLNGVAYGWDQIAKAIDGAWKKLKDFTNGDPIAKQIADAQVRVKELQDKINAPLGLTTNYAGLEQAKEQLKIEQQRLFVLQSGQSLEKGAATEKAAQNKQLEAQAALDKEHDKYLSKAVERERELAKIRDTTARANSGLQKTIDYGGAGAEQARKTLIENQRKLAEAEAGIRKRFAETKAPTAKPDAFQSDVAKAYTKALDDLDKVQLKASASADTLSKTQETLRNIQAGPEWAAMSFRKKEEIIMAASLAQAEEDRANVLKAAAKVQNDYNNAASESANAVANKLQALGDETQAYTLAAEKNISLAEAIDLVAIARLEEEVIRAKIANNDGGVKQLEREIELRKELAGKLKLKANYAAETEAGKAAAAATMAEWKRGWEKTDRLARDAFTSWAENGTSMAEAIGKSLKKALLSAIYEATLKPIAFQLYTSIAGGGGAATALQAASGASGASGVANGFGAASGASSLMPWLTSFGTKTASMLGDLGATMVSTGSEMLGDFGGMLINNSSAIGSAAESIGTGMGYLSAAISASKGEWGAAVGATIGTYYGGPIGAAIGSAIGGAVDKAFGGGSEYSVASGLRLQATQGNLSTQNFNQWRNDGSSGLFGLGGAAPSTGFNYSAADSKTTKQFADAYAGILTQTGAFATALGLNAEHVKNVTADITLNLAGLSVDEAKQKVVGAFTDLANGAASAYTDAIQGYAKAGETSSVTLARLATDLTVVNAMFGKLGTGLNEISVTGASSASNLIQAFGGLDKMQQSVGTYYDLFYTSAEKSANAALSLSGAFDQLGIAVPKSNAEFRALVDGIDRTTTAGQSLYASVIGLAPAFDQVAQAAMAAQNNMLSAAQNWGTPTDVRSIQAGILQQTLANSGLELTLQQILGATQQSVLAFYNGLDPSSAAAKALLANQQAIYTFVNSGNTANTPLLGSNTSSGESGSSGGIEAVNPAIAERLTLQGQLDALTMTNVQLLEKQRNALDASNRALFDQVQAAQAAKDAADQRLTLQDQLDALTMTNVQFLNKQRDALHESNKELFDQVQAAQAAKAAMEQQKTLQDQWNQLTMTAVQLRALEREAIAASNLELFDRITALQNARTGVDAALAAVQRAIDAEKKGIEAARQAANERVGILKSIVDTTGNAIDSLRGNVPGTKEQAAREGMAFIANAAANAAVTGYMPDVDDLKKAITNAMAGINDSVGKTEFERNRDSLVLAGQLEAIKKTAKPQLTAAEEAVKLAEDQLKALDAQLEQARKQVDALRGIDTSVKTVAEAIAALTAAILAEGNLTGATRPTPTTPLPNIGGVPQNGLSYAEIQAQANNLANWIGDPVAAGTALYGVATRYGYTSDDLDKAMGWAPGHALEWALANGLPAFATGTNMVPRDMAAIIHQGEAIVPAAYNPAAGGTSGNARLEALVEGLTKEVQRLQGIVNEGNRSNDRIAEAVHGNPDRPIPIDVLENTVGLVTA